MVFKIHECFMIFSCVFFESNFHKEKNREELGKNLPERFNPNFYCIFGRKVFMNLYLDFWK